MIACAVPGCKERVPPLFRLCRTHWQRVPGDKKDALQQALGPRRKPGPGYAVALAEAVAAAQQPPDHDFTNMGSPAAGGRGGSG